MPNRVIASFGNEQVCQLLSEDVAWLQGTIYAFFAIALFILLAILVLEVFVMIKTASQKGGQQNFTVILRELREFNKSITNTNANIHLLLREITSSLKEIRQDLRTHESKDDAVMDSIRNSLTELKQRTPK